METVPSPPNAAQIEYWNGQTGARWSAQQERIDELFAPLTEAVVDAAAPGGHERVLDVGCGCGASLLALAGRLDPDGHIMGVDVSAVMLEVARARTARDERVRVVQADAATYGFAPGSFDLLFSRFGVMFFDDPTAAFAHMRPALAPTGRLAFVAWRAMAENPWFTVPFAAVASLLPERPQTDPLAPGPFAFADPDRVRAVLEGAGFHAVRLVRHDLTMRLGGPGETAAAAQFAARIGPAASLLAEADEPTRHEAVRAIQAALSHHETPAGLSLPASVWLVSASA